jgi:hypothetical protein
MQQRGFLSLISEVRDVSNHVIRMSQICAAVDLFLSKGEVKFCDKCLRAHPRDWAVESCELKKCKGKVVKGNSVFLLRWMEDVQRKAALEQLTKESNV